MTLRAWRAGDAPVVLRAFQAADMARQTPWPILTLKDAQGWIASWEGVGDAFAVLLDGRIAGNVALTGVEVSYWTAPEARGQGVATAAVNALARWAFEERGLFRLELGHRTDNPASCTVALKAGFRPEGVDDDVERHARLATDPGADLRS
ncbi:GNAT family N-acetyltransferase [Nonomuraea sediminis]|uniref:GNAT family N-acetyltransferase n=1 Tax=Nonomuraea sediminis TaxID=2835864 RepID=UPI001BDD3151|nr:GNAT family N-acetyltransferase [Nonomuraea sediminis]